MAVVFGLEISDLIFLLYGLVIVMTDAYGVVRPRLWIEWLERQFVYRRERIVVGILLFLLGAGPIYIILPVGGWEGYLLSVTSGLFLLLGLMLLILPDVLRQGLLALAGLSDRWLRILILADALCGAALVVIGLLPLLLSVM